MPTPPGSTVSKLAPHGKSHRMSMAVIKHHHKTTIIVSFIIKIGIISLCTSFDGRLQSKIKDDLDALDNPIRFSSNKNDSMRNEDSIPGKT